MALFRTIQGDFTTDMVSDGEMLSFLQQKVTEKYPQGEIEVVKPFMIGGTRTVFLVRTTPATIGVYNAVSCAVNLVRCTKGGKLLVSVDLTNADGTDLIQAGITLFTIRKRSALIEEVVGWLLPFLQAKQNHSASPTVESSEEILIAKPLRKCDGCGAEVALQESVCPYCGRSVPDHAGQLSLPKFPSQASHDQPSVGQGPRKSKTAYVLLGIFLGQFGIHNFYAGCKSKGIAQILITVLTVGYGSIVSWIWAIVEVCTARQDAKGNLFV